MSGMGFINIKSFFFCAKKTFFVFSMSEGAIMRIFNSTFDSFINKVSSSVSSNSRTRNVSDMKQNDELVKPSCVNLQARYMPSFAGYRKAGETTVIDKKTGLKVPAAIQKEKTGDFLSLRLMVGKKEAGFLDMYCNSVFPEDSYVLPEPTNSMPEVRHLRSILGNDYSGIGTALIKTAIQESCNNGGFGNLWLESEKGYEKTLTSYRSNENPIPFYYRMGFISPNEDIDKQIKTCLKKTDYLKLPESTLLLLTPESRNYWIEELISNPIIKFKELPDIA